MPSEGFVKQNRFLGLLKRYSIRTLPSPTCQHKIASSRILSTQLQILRHQLTNKSVLTFNSVLQVSFEAHNGGPLSLFINSCPLWLASELAYSETEAVALMSGPCLISNSATHDHSYNDHLPHVNSFFGSRTKVWPLCHCVVLKLDR